MQHQCSRFNPISWLLHMPPLRALISSVFAGGAALASFSQLASVSLEDINPVYATKLWPGNDQAWARRGSQALASIPDAKEMLENAGPTPASRKPLQQLIQYNQAALRANPLQVIALRNLAYAHLLLGERERLEIVLGAANATTRRDVPTQILLTRQYLVEENLTKGLASFDKALRLSDRAHEQLFPLLVEAVKLPEFQEAFRPYVNADNRWLAEFLEFALVQKLAPRQIGQLIAEAGPLPSRQGNEIRSFAPVYLVAAGEATLARAIAMQAPADQRPAPAGGLSDQNFSKPDIIAPFGWSFNDSRELVFIHANDSGPLEISSSVPYSGDLVTQLLTLASGHYRLTSDGQFGTNVSWRVRCEGTRDMLVTDVTAKPVSFTVPKSGCGAQYLALQAQALDQIDAVIKSVSITRISAVAE